MKIVRTIDYFDKESEKLVGQKVIDLNTSQLVNIFGLKEGDEEFYDPRDIGESEAQVLQSLLKIQFEFEKYDYELGCHSDDS